MDVSDLSSLARLCWWLDARRWIIAAWNVAAAGLFVVGCLGFYSPRLYVESVTMFLGGSVLFLLSAAGSALLQHGPSR